RSSHQDTEDRTMTEQHTDAWDAAARQLSRIRNAVQRAVDDTQQDMLGINPVRDRVLSARHVRRQADNALHDAVLNARGAGFTWSEVAADLGMVASDDGTPRAVRAFEWVVSDHATDRVYWTCNACGDTVADSGPYDANPANCE